MLSENITLRRSKRRPFADNTNFVVKHCSNVPYIKTSAINATKDKQQMTKSQNELDLKVFVKLNRCNELENLLTTENKSLQQNHNDSKTTTMHLRKRKVKDYNDLLKGSPELEKQICEQHVPIYLQKYKSKERTKIKDPFKFVDEHPKKNKVDDNTDSDSSTFDKSIQEIMSNLRNKDKKREKKAKALHRQILKKNLISTNQELSKQKDTHQLSNVNKKQPEMILKEQSNLLQPATTSTPITDAMKTKSPSKEINIISQVVIQPQIKTSTKDVLENICEDEANSPIHDVPDTYDDTNDFDRLSITSSSVYSFPDDFRDVQSFAHPNYSSSSTPWRGDLYVRRKFPWLTLKSSWLPSHTQEMIWQHEQVEKIQTSKPLNKENSYVQTQITDFTSEKKDNLNRLSNNISLFDENEFSPIKIQNNKTSLNISNNSSLFDESSFSPPKNSTKTNIENVKRNILGSLNENSSLSKIDNALNVQDFDFSFTNDENKENKPRQFKNKKKSLRALPMRLSLTDVKRVQNEVMEEFLENIAINESLDENLSDAEPTEDEDDYVGVGLFEDLEPPPGEEQIPKKQKSVRKERKQKKKKKDFKTKAEENAFNAWAASFNAMCDEVEQHTLEIE